MENQSVHLNQKQCESSKSGYSWLWQLAPLEQQSTSKLIALAFKEARASLAALSKSLSNSRVYMAMFLMLVVSPLSSVTYQLFDQHAHYAGWYHVNYFYLFLILSPHISLLLALTGVFLLMPESRRAFFLIIPVGYHVSKILWLVQVTSNEEFYRIVPLTFLLLGGLATFVWLFTFNWLMALHFHKREGMIARIIGIMNAPDIDPADKERIAQEQIKLLNSLKQL